MDKDTKETNKSKITAFAAYIFKSRYLVWDLMLMGVAILLNVFASCMNPLLFKELFDRVLPSEAFYLLMLLLSVIFILFVINTIAIITQNKLCVRISDKVTSRLRLQLFNCAQNIDRREGEKDLSGSILTRFTEDISFVEQSIIYSFFAGMKYGLLGLISIALLIYINIYLSLAVLIFLPLSFALSSRYLTQSEQYAESVKNNKIDLFAKEQESILMQEIVKWLRIKNFKRKMYKNIIKKYSPLKNAYNIKLGLASTSNVLGTNLITIVVLALGVTMVMLKQLTIGEMIAFLVLLGYLGSSITFLSGQYPMIAKGALSLDHIRTLLGRHSKHTHTGCTLHPIRQQIDFVDVTVRYHEKEVLSSVNVRIKAGQRVAFVGKSGAGKSTLLKTFLREIPLAAGEIRLDGENLNSFSYNAFYSQVGVVAQQPKLFKASIKENIRLGKLDATDAEIIEAATLAGVHQDILLQRDGYDTMIDEDNPLSGGQVQRIAVARALIAKPSVLCVDEATSALDPISAFALEKTFLTLPREMTVLIVTHRLKSMNQMDQIFVLDHGRLVGQGTQQTLLDQNGLYTALFEKQAGIHLEKDLEHAVIDVKWLKHVPLFSTLEDKILEQLSSQFLVEKVNPGTKVVEEGTIGNIFYVIASGVVEVSVFDKTLQERKVLSLLSDGDYFGEIALLFNIPRTATVETKGFCVLLTLHRSQAEKIFNQLSDEAKALLVETAKKRLNHVELPQS